jgi:nucleoid-associated protein YgaU
MVQKEVKIMSNLKNIRQIGTPTEADKVYMEAAAYDRIHAEEIAEKRVFVLMGHTECEEQRYATFVESVIAVRDIDFDRNIPVWNNRVWNVVFREIKNSYEDAVIVGWAVDVKGAAMQISEELEAVHREQFGGIHQLLLLMDSLEPEENFYQMKNNHLRQKEGFYIYYNQEPKQHVPEVQLEFPASEEFFRRETQGKMQEEESAAPYNTVRTKARYRQLQQEASGQESGKTASRLGAMVAAVLVIAILGTALSKNQFLSVFSEKTNEPEETAEETSQDSGWTIPLVEVSGGEVIGSEEPQTGSEEDSIRQGEQQQDEQQQENVADAGISSDEDATASEPAAVADAADSQDDAAAEEVLAPDVQESVTYIVQKGDTLLGICRQQYGTADRLEEVEQLNGITDPDAIYVGQQLLLPQ